jgi:hypothetical protein
MGQEMRMNPPPAILCDEIRLRGRVSFPIGGFEDDEPTARMVSEVAIPPKGDVREFFTDSEHPTGIPRE